MSYTLDVTPSTINPGGEATVAVGLPDRGADEEFQVSLTRRSDGEVAGSGTITLHRPPWTVGVEGDEGTDYYVTLDGDTLEVEQTGEREFVVRAPGV